MDGDIGGEPLADVVRPTLMSAALAADAARVAMPKANSAAGAVHLFLNCFISPSLLFLSRTPISDRTL